MSRLPLERHDDLPTGGAGVSKYLDFLLLSDSGKTRTYTIRSRSRGDVLAIVKWYGAWRQYTMEPLYHTVWNKDCLREVAEFLDGLMEQRRSALPVREPQEAPA